MRRNPTFAERTLWRLLRDGKLEGAKFRRQAPIGPYIVDFVCFARRLVVEVDGYYHSLDPERDARRDAWLKAEGYRVLHLKDGFAGGAPEEALRLIRAALASDRMAERDPSSDPLWGPPSPPSGRRALVS